MAVTQPYSRIIVPGIGARRIRFAATALAVLIFVLLRDHWPWTVSYPRAWIVPATEWINSGMGWLIGSFDLGLFTFKEFTRGIAWTIAWPLKWTESLLVTGFGEGLFGVLPWLSVVGLAVILGHYIRGWRLACLAGACVLYLAVFGQWSSSMRTFATVLVCVPLAAGIGLALGIAAARSARVEAAVLPLMDLMQSIPHYALQVARR